MRLSSTAFMEMFEAAMKFLRISTSGSGREAPTALPKPPAVEAQAAFSQATFQAVGTLARKTGRAQDATAARRRQGVQRTPYLYYVKGSQLFSLLLSKDASGLRHETVRQPYSTCLGASQVSQGLQSRRSQREGCLLPERFAHQLCVLRSVTGGHLSQIGSLVAICSTAGVETGKDRVERGRPSPQGLEEVDASITEERCLTDRTWNVLEVSSNGWWV